MRIIFPRQGRLWGTSDCASCSAEWCAEGNTQFGCGDEIDSNADYLHTNHPELTKRMVEVGGFDIRIRTPSTADVPFGYPPYSAKVEPRRGFIAPSGTAFVIPIDRVGIKAPVHSDDMRARLGLLGPARLIVSGHQSDATVESVWKNRLELVRALARCGYDLALVPSFSTWDKKTRLEHRYQIARGLRFFELLMRHDIPTMPNVSWYLEHDIDDWAAELPRFGQRAFSVDLQTLQTRAKWQMTIQALTSLVEQIGSGWEVFVNGVCRWDRIRELADLFGHIHLINANAYESAMAIRTKWSANLLNRAFSYPDAMDEFHKRSQFFFDAASEFEPGRLCRAGIGTVQRR